MKTILSFLALALVLPCPLHAATLRLANLFTDHTVLQRERPAPVWGWADPGEAIRVEFAGQTKSTTAGADGRWLVRLDPMPASAEPRTLAIRSAAPDRKYIIYDVLVGDVWLCTGQSNMGISMNVPGNEVLQRAIREAGNPMLRLYQTVHQFPENPAADTDGTWRLAEPGSVRDFIAIGYVFGNRIQRETGVPVGIISAAMGGTWIENWIPREVLDANPLNRPFIEQFEATLAKLPELTAKYEAEFADFQKLFPTPRDLEEENAARKARNEGPLAAPRAPVGPGHHNVPSACFNGKIAPLSPLAIKGVLWYQGEGNVWGFDAYPSQMADLMRSWRALFEQPALPFIMTELAPFGEPSATPQDSPRARFGEALAKTAKADDHAWVITIVDGGDPLDIHPPKKEIPGERFAAMALRKVYDNSGIAHGPVLDSWKAEAGKAILKFTSVGSGLLVKDVDAGGHAVKADRLQGFELAGEDRRFYRATAELQGNDTVVVSAAEVPQPVAVRYAWAAFPLCNLFNQEGFAAYPFRTDDWPFPTPAHVGAR